MPALRAEELGIVRSLAFALWVGAKDDVVAIPPALSAVHYGVRAPTGIRTFFFAIVAFPVRGTDMAVVAGP